MQGIRKARSSAIRRELAVSEIEYSTVVGETASDDCGTEGERSATTSGIHSHYQLATVCQPRQHNNALTEQIIEDVVVSVEHTGSQELRFVRFAHELLQRIVREQVWEQADTRRDRTPLHILRAFGKRLDDTGLG